MKKMNAFCTHPEGKAERGGNEERTVYASCNLTELSHSVTALAARVALCASRVLRPDGCLMYSVSDMTHKR